MVEVIVSRLGIDPGTQGYVVVLQEKGGSRLLPIWIGHPEAQSIVMHMQNMKRQRPITHDLCKSLIVAAGVTLRRIEITRVEENTYYGELHLERGGTITRVDSRPSDAIAIAIRLDAPMFASESLLMVAEEEQDDDDAGSETFGPPATAAEDTELSPEQLKKYLEHLRPEDFGKFNL